MSAFNHTVAFLFSEEDVEQELAPPLVAQGIY